MFTVYQHKNKVNGKVYKGITSRNPQARWGTNGNGYKSSPHFHSAILKYGWDNFEHNILFVGLSKDDACAKEKAKKIGDSQRGRKFTDEHKDKLSKSASKRHTPCSLDKRITLSMNYPHKKRVYCVELNKVFDSVQSCGRELGIPPTNISKLCKGRGVSLKGMHFKYYEETSEETI